MTTGIAQYMRELERMWDGHRNALLTQRDPATAVEPLAAGASVQHLPAGSGAVGRPAVQRFYAEEFLPYLPDDLRLARISRTVDRFQLVDELTVSFTHDREMPWLLPGVPPTHRRAEVLAIAVVSFERGQIRGQRILWDHATLAAQLGAPASAEPRSS